MKIGTYKQNIPEHYLVSTDADIIIAMKSNQTFLKDEIIKILSEHFDIIIEDDRLTGRQERKKLI